MCPPAWVRCLQSSHTSPSGQCAPLCVGPPFVHLWRCAPPPRSPARSYPTFPVDIQATEGCRRVCVAFDGLVLPLLPAALCRACDAMPALHRALTEKV